MPTDTTLLEYGLPGAIIVVLLGVIRSLYNDNKTLEKELRDTLREVIPAVDAVVKAAQLMERMNK